jgi:hypothetical protein
MTATQAQPPRGDSQHDPSRVPISPPSMPQSETSISLPLLPYVKLPYRDNVGNWNTLKLASAPSVDGFLDSALVLGIQMVDALQGDNHATIALNLHAVPDHEVPIEEIKWTDALPHLALRYPR